MPYVTTAIGFLAGVLSVLALQRALDRRPGGPARGGPGNDDDEGNIALSVRALEARNERRGGSTDGADADAEQPTTEPPNPTATAPRARLFALASDLEDFYEASAHPSDLLSDDGFRQAVELLGDEDAFPVQVLLEYYGTSNVVVCNCALEALARRTPDPELVDVLIRRLDKVAGFNRWFALRALDRHAPPTTPVIVRVLGRAEDRWHNELDRRTFSDWIERRLAAGETPDLSTPLQKRAWADDLLRLLDRDGTREFAEGLRGILRTWDLEFLRQIGQVRLPKAAGDPDPDAGFVMREHLDEPAASVVAGMLGQPRRSHVVVGEHGVGKSVFVGRIADRLRERGFTVFEAGPVELIAGQSYIGELEQRLRQLVDNLSDQPIVWVVRDLYNLVFAGQHRHNQSGVLDSLLPHVETGALLLLGEMEPKPYEKLVRQRPRVRNALEVVEFLPLSLARTRALALAWGSFHGAPSDEGGRRPLVGEPEADEAIQLAQQYLNDAAFPGAVVRLLEQARRLAGGTADGAGTRPLARDDLLAALSSLTSLPVSILDDRTGLDLDELRQRFESRVKGQREAVDVLVERIAMIKAGLTDPGRPPGVFLFVGPTGTGKTEMVKALAEALFDSPDRMIRLDMSELQGFEGTDRILGSAAAGQDAAPGLGDDEALVHRIRKQPFTVVLLDEIEKAHPSVFDLFLQVFDDGRLTDRNGRVADCRHAIFVLTSNLGATAHGLAFGEGDQDAEERALRQAFRPEFLNRIDRVVRFLPLSRAVLREVLMKELDRALGRRGLRNRQWAVEWDPSAIDFLLQQGYTPDLGARPLRRAIERWLLAPLARTIVQHEAPAGDQFLFVRSDGHKIDVDFVDPDAPADSPASTPRPADEPADVGGRRTSIRRIALEARGTADEIALVGARGAQLLAQVDCEGFRARKAAAFDAMGQHGFWDDDRRFAVLGRAEAMDRIENATRSAARLLERLTGAPAGAPPRRDHCDPAPLKHLAERIWLLEQAVADLDEDEGPDAVLGVETVRDARTGSLRDETARFADRVCAMYRAWAEARGMDWKTLGEAPVLGSVGGAAAAEPGARYGRLVAEVGGFAARRLLRPEAGLHVFEKVDDQGNVIDRLRVRVTVAAHDGRPAHGSDAKRLAAAKAMLDAARSEHPTVVRRYREDPTPLVRDAVRGYRTGRIDRVFAGHFDLVT